MNRRSILASLAGGTTLSLSGCVETLHATSQIASIEAVGTEFYETSEENPWETPEGTDYISISDLDLSIDVSVEAETVTESSPAQLSLTVESDSETASTFRVFGYSMGEQSTDLLSHPVFNTVESYTGYPSRLPALYLVPAGADIESEDDECVSRDANGRAMSSSDDQRIINFNDPQHQEFEIWNDGNNEGCFPPGEYIAPQWYDDPEDTARRLYWAITLEVTE